MRLEYSLKSEAQFEGLIAGNVMGKETEPVKTHAAKIADRRQAFAAYEEAKRDSGLLKTAHPAHAGRKKPFSEIPDIEGERVVLDKVVDTDADALRDLVDNPLVQRYLPTFLFEKQFDDAHEAIREMYGELFESKESLILAIRVKEEGELAGLAEFYGLCDRLHKVSVGLRFRECWWGHGLATEATRLMVDYLYGETDIEIVTASTRIENKASAHALEKVGFIRTACGVDEDWGFHEPTIVDKWFY